MNYYKKEAVAEPPLGPPQNIWKKIVDIQSMSHPNQIWKILSNRYARTRHSQTYNKHTDILTIISQNKKRKKKVSSFSSIAANTLESHSNVPKAIVQHMHDATVATITSESSHISQSLAA